MRPAFVAFLVLAGLLLVPGPLQAQSDECIPSGGTEILAKDSGTSEGRWFVHEISKPAGSHLKVGLEVFEFRRNGPALGTSILVDGKGNVVQTKTVRTDDHRASASVGSSTAGLERTLAGPAFGNLIRPSALLDGGVANEAGYETLYWVVGFDVDTGETLDWRWTVKTAIDNCSEVDPTVTTSDGDRIELYTTGDLQADRKISAGAHLPGWIQGVGTFTEGARVTYVENGTLGLDASGHPLVSWAWDWELGDGIQVAGPDGSWLSQEGVCKEQANYPTCAGWGPNFPGGRYEVTVNGTALPDPATPQRHNAPGPYVLVAETTRP